VTTTAKVTFALPESLGSDRLTSLQLAFLMVHLTVAPFGGTNVGAGEYRYFPGVPPENKNRKPWHLNTDSLKISQAFHFHKF
jgi:hypothetical protein